ncbi:SRPBCC family protein [Govanella unica]|uniref:SRPBCC family protein n=1 Tax=Govanella unica TaxID=2975056 RepID=A0A9X3Z7G4_9PROT|nr:SRPBCC family protein [Govania unica]MDA5194132.1 SRPBCC family protein [Govania unica]
MGQACVTARYEAPAEKVWEYLTWFGVKKLTGSSLFKSVEFDGSEQKLGAVRTLHLHEGLPVSERLIEFDDRDRLNVYRVIDAGPLQVIDYVGRIRVTPSGPDACFVKINCDFTAVGMTDAEWQVMWETMEAQLLEDLRKLVEA